MARAAAREPGEPSVLREPEPYLGMPRLMRSRRHPPPKPTGPVVPRVRVEQLAGRAAEARAPA